MALGRFAKLALQISQHAAVIDRARLSDWLKAASAVLDGEGGTIGPFNTVAKGVAGSGRLLDITAAQLAALDPGTLVWVKSFKDTWRWEPTRTDTADNKTVCSPTANGVNPGRFIRELQPAPEWALQATWFIDETNGNEENDGLTSGTALKTDLELNRRWGRVKLAQPTTITYLSSPAVETHLDVELLSAASLTFVGTRTTTKTDTITAVTALNRGTQTPWDITTSTLGAADVGKIVRITGGARAGAYAVIVKDMGAGQVRISPFGTFAAAESGNFTLATPAISDPIEVVSQTTLKVGLISLKGSGLPSAASPRTGSLVFDSLTLDGGNTTGTIYASAVKTFFAQSLVKNLILTGATGGGTSFAFYTFCGSGADRVQAGVGATAQLRATAITGNGLGAAMAGRLSFINDPIFQGAGLSCSAGSAVASSGASYFDCPGTALLVSTGASYAQSGATADWGTNNTGQALVMQAGGSYVYATKPTVNSGLGAGREAKVGGTDKLLSALPYFEPLNGAQISLLQ